jgi:uncharacterized protein
MTVEVHPVGMACNLGCTYCYENPMRDAGNITFVGDTAAMIRALEKERSPFSIFGGEPLLTPIPVLTELFKFGFEKHKANNIQTNGVLITDELIELFLKYNVHVGISIDGPGGMNKARISNNGLTLEATETTMTNVQKLVKAGIIPSFISTLHQLNVGDDIKLGWFILWLGSLDDLGVKNVILHLLEPDGKVDDLILPAAQAIHAFKTLSGHKFKNIKFDIFDHMEQLLLSDESKASCVWHACDPYTTAAVQGIDADGTRTNCGRTNKDGVAFRKADEEGHERQLALYQTPMEDGGCKGCRFFLVCKGYCPGTAIDGDWRNKTVHCEVITGLLEHYENALIESGKTPVSVAGNRLELEAKLLQKLSGRNSHRSGVGTSHSDRAHGDSHGDAPHGDLPHGDSGTPKIIVPICDCAGKCKGHVLA